jgi:hypothetical protein
VGMLGEGEGVGDSILVLMVVQTMALGNLRSKCGREKRVPGVGRRRRAARGDFCRAGEGELRHQKGGGYNTPVLL